MQKNIKLDGKQLISDYIKSMETVIEEQKQYQQLYLNDSLPDDYFNYNKSIKFTRVWDILLSMDNYAARNLLLLFNACGCRYKQTLEALWGLNVEYKNEATLRVMITKARKIIKDIYYERYEKS